MVDKYINRSKRGIIMQNTYVSVNLTQDFTDAQKVTARTNIGAADKSAFNRLSDIVENNTYEIAGIKSRIAPGFGSGTVAYNSSGDNLICELSACKVYASISSENYCQLKVIADNTNSEESITLALASAVITMIPILIVYLFAQSKIIEGVANTGIKR